MSEVKNQYEKENFYNFYYLAGLFNFYKIFVSLTLFLMNIRLINFFFFSKKISIILDVIAEAKLDVLFFILIFSLV